MTFDNLLFLQKDGVATIKFNRPEAFNALDFGLGNDLVEALETCADDKKTKVVIITGVGKAFCAGGDLSLIKNSSNTSDTLRQLIKVANLAILGIRQMPKPVIASINGVTSGVGMSIAAACDLRICASAAKFKQAYTSVGLVPDGGWTMLIPMLVGFGKASELALLDTMFGAAEAMQLGFVNNVVNDSELDKATYSIALKMACGPSVAYGIVKNNLNHALFRNLEYQLELERKSMIEVTKTEDAQEGIAAFLEKRKPRYSGK